MTSSVGSGRTNHQQRRDREDVDEQAQAEHHLVTRRLRRRPDQSTEHPLGIGGEHLHEWLLPLKALRESHGEEGGEVNASAPVDTVSTATMEIIDNAFILIVPGAMVASVADGLFWVEPRTQSRDRVRSNRAGQPLADRTRPRPRRHARTTRPLAPRHGRGLPEAGSH
jgi:hypothetical protein